MGAEAAAADLEALDGWEVAAAERKTVVARPSEGRDALRLDELVPLMASHGLVPKYAVRGSGKVQFVENGA